MIVGWTKISTTVAKHCVKDGRQVTAVTYRYRAEDGEEDEVTILRGFYANDNYDLSDFGLDSNALVSADVASTISQSSDPGNGSRHS
jgi:hypothetical protein